MTTIAATMPTMKDKRLEFSQWVLSTSCRACLTAFVCVMAILYVFETNAISTKGFLISDLERKQETLQQEQQRLTVQIAQYRSMKSVEERLAHTDLVPADSVAYVNVVGSAMALR